jgi:hypothetical protein
MAVSGNTSQTTHILVIVGNMNGHAGHDRQQGSGLSSDKSCVSTEGIIHDDIRFTLCDEDVLYTRNRFGGNANNESDISYAGDGKCLTAGKFVNRTGSKVTRSILANDPVCMGCKSDTQASEITLRTCTLEPGSAVKLPWDPAELFRLRARSVWLDEIHWQNPRIRQRL